MKIGIYIEDFSPSAGGGYTFSNIIKKNIISSNCEYEICFFFNDKNAPHYIYENKIIYINTFKEEKKNTGIKEEIKIIIRKFKPNFHNEYKPNFDEEFDNLLKTENIDLLCIMGPFKLNISIPYIFIIWDLGHRMLPCFPELSKNGQWEWRESLYKEMLYRATYIVTGNETGKKEIINNYSIDPNRIHIIPFPVPDFCFENIEIPLKMGKINSPYIFYPAQFWSHKNHISLIESIALLKNKKNIIINCYLTGSDQGNLSYIKNQIKKYNLDNQIFILDFVDYPMLIYLYKNALAMTYVSLMGPNNLPPLEAAALGCPLIFSNLPGHIEQMEGTGIAVNATNPEEICEAVYSLYINPDLRKKIIIDEIKLSEKYKNYSYFEQLKKLFDAYSLYLKTWKAVK